MANQPKKYKKFVATAATATLVASAIVPVASAANLSDISGNTHEEAINALVDAGVINGYPDGTFKPNKALTRSDVVKLLGKYLETEGYKAASEYKTQPAFKDLKVGSNEELLKYASIVKEAGVFVGSNGNLLPSDLITRENMAITLVRMVNTLEGVSLEEFVAGEDFKGDVKDLNAAKAEARSAISVLDFYDITNPAVSEFNPKGNTTRGQFASFLYKTISTDFSKVPTNEASEVVPEKVDLVEKSTQGKYGENVTLKVKVTTKAGESAANIPVTFAIDPGRDQLLADQIKEEVLTDAEGVATYSYTRHNNQSTNVTDTVVAYASAKTTVRTTGKVYWNQSLAITDVTEATTIANSEEKIYQITGKKNSVVYVAFAENLNVKPNEVVRDVEYRGLQTTGDTASLYPYETTTGGFAAGVIRLDNNGKANLVLTGKDASATPIIYVADNVEGYYSEDALQVKGSTVKFSAESLYDLSVTAEGSQFAANYYNPDQIGGRDYVVTLKGKDGKPLSNAVVKLAFTKKTGTFDPEKVLVFNENEELVTADSADLREFTTDKDGKVTFTVSGNTNEYATPNVFIGKNLDDNSILKTGEIVYFQNVKSSDYKSELLVKDGNKATTSFGNGKTATFTYQLSDQNGKARSYSADTNVVFTVRAGSQPITVTNADGVETKIAAWGSAPVNGVVKAGEISESIEVKSDTTGASEVRVTATPTYNGLSGLASISKTINFLSGASTSDYTVTSAKQATADVVTLTFTENVTASSITVTTANGTTAHVSADSSNSKVLYIRFVNTATNAGLVAGDKFTVQYKTTVTTFEYLGNGEFK